MADAGTIDVLQVQLLGNYNFFIYDADEFGSQNGGP
jgi:hypothetical protein